MTKLTSKYRVLFFWLITMACLLFGVVDLASTEMRRDSSEVIISEFLAANGTGIIDSDGDRSDWIEIYNRGNKPVNLSGWALTDDPAEPEKWTFPNITLGSHDYLIIFASGKDRNSTQPGAELHANFRLNRTGEFLGLYNIFAGHFMSELSPRYPKQFRDVAYGRSEEDLTYRYLSNPSPAARNDQGSSWVDAVAPVEFSVARGFYNEPIIVELSSSTPRTTIYYTTDGSEPTETNGKLFTHPFKVDQTTAVRAVAYKANYRPSDVTTHTYIFLNDIRSQPVQPPGFPATWGTHIIDFAGHAAGSPVIADYEMDPDIVHNERYSQLLDNGLKSIPSISLVTDMAVFAELYSNPRERGREWERPVSVELIQPNDGEKGFQVNAGVRIQGGIGRWEYMPKHSFRLFFKGQYGPTKLEYPLFPDSPVESFDTVVLRGGVNKSFAGRPRGQGDVDHRQAVYTRDEWLRASQIAMSGVGSHGIFVHLYLNGLYWGLYNLVERPDASFTSSYLGGQKEDWLAVSQGITTIGNDVLPGETISGSRERFDTLFQLAAQGGLEDPVRYAQIQSYLDTTQFIDYAILNWYAGNRDWADNNWYAGIRNPSGRLNFFVWDGENTWDKRAWIDLGDVDVPDRPNLIRPLFEALMENPDFRMELADRLYKHLSNNGALTDAVSQARWLKITNRIDPAIVGESARWGDVRYERPVTRDDWLAARDHILDRMDGNALKMIAEAREEGYYPSVDPPTFSQPNNLIATGVQLTMAAPEGNIYYTLDGTDPRQPVSGAIAPQATKFSEPIVLVDPTTHIKARTVIDAPTGRGMEWSALHEATFRVVAQDVNLQFTEIMYNPLGGDDYEFIELKNTGVRALDLSDMSFSGIRFDFPPNTPLLAPGAVLVLVANAEAFVVRYPNVPIAGQYQGRLSNQGEAITLYGKDEEVIVSVDYDDENGWPVSPDGRGDSLVLLDPNRDPNNPQNWRASIDLQGTPGFDESLP